MSSFSFACARGQLASAGKVRRAELGLGCSLSRPGCSPLDNMFPGLLGCLVVSAHLFPPLDEGSMENTSSFACLWAFFCSNVHLYSCTKVLLLLYYLKKITKASNFLFFFFLITLLHLSIKCQVARCLSG